MKLIIDIPEAIYKTAQKTNIIEANIDMLAKTIRNGTPIPDNATNGDVIKALYPNESIGHCEDCTDLGDIATFDDDWWNAPYQKGGKSEER